MSFRNVVSKSELLREKAELAAAKSVDKILTTKKDVLLQRLSGLSGEIEKGARAFLETLNESYAYYLSTIASNGEEAVEHMSRASEGRLEVEAFQTGYMGVKYLDVTPKLIPKSASLDYNYHLLMEKKVELVSRLASFATLWSFALKLIQELKDTDRLINALEKVIIPEREERVRVLSLVLEERDREELTRIKKVREKLRGE